MMSKTKWDDIFNHYSSGDITQHLRVGQRLEIYNYVLEPPDFNKWGGWELFNIVEVMSPTELRLDRDFSDEDLYMSDVLSLTSSNDVWRIPNAHYKRKSFKELIEEY